MLEFTIANLLLEEESFEVPSAFGKWEFGRFGEYAKNALAIREKGMCGNTYFASLESIVHSSDIKDFQAACDEIIDICLVLSFLTARCVTPTGNTEQSEMRFLFLEDKFVLARSIVGFPEIKPSALAHYFSDWLTLAYPAYKKRTLRLQLCHWLSGLTCFSLEDIFLSAGVQMDIIKQREKAHPKQMLAYFEGMCLASARYKFPPLGHDFKSMRNDIVHEGVLSGSNFPGKTKSECAAVVADTLNWIDTYILSVLGKPNTLPGLPRWIGTDLEHGLPALTII